MAFKNWSTNSVTANTLTQLLQVASGKEAAIVSLIIANRSELDATVEVYITDSSDVTKATIISGKVLTGKQTLIFDGKLLLANQDKVKIKSDVAEVSFMANGDES